MGCFVLITLSLAQVNNYQRWQHRFVLNLYIHFKIKLWNKDKVTSEKYCIVPSAVTFMSALLFLSPFECSLVWNFHLSPSHGLKVNFFWCILKLILLLWRVHASGRIVSGRWEKLSVVIGSKNGEWLFGNFNAFEQIFNKLCEYLHAVLTALNRNNFVRGFTTFRKHVSFSVVNKLLLVTIFYFTL